MSERPGIEIRRLRDSDFDEFTRLHEQLDRLHREAMPGRFREPAPDGTPFRSREHYGKLLADPVNLVIGATGPDGRLAGVAHAIDVRVPAGSVQLAGHHVLV